jgi:hypothetical protein
MAKRIGARAGSARTGAAIAAAGLLLATAAAFGQDSGSVTVDVGKCVDLESPEDRLACFEAQVDGARRGAERAPASTERSRRAAEAEPAPAAPRTDAGAATADRPPAATQPADAEKPRRAANRDDAPRRQRKGEVQEYAATVTALRETVPNAWLITLDNGQVWRQMRPQWYPLQPGQRVRVYSTNWGRAFRLTNDEMRGFLQVERVR